jgi:quercetin dioxygenase-like cupin family protein
MEIERKPPTAKGPADWFTGDVWIDSIVEPQEPSRLNVGAVRFSPDARTAWHSHDGGQTLYVTEGEGRAQSRGEPIAQSDLATWCTRRLASGTGTGLRPITS